MKKNESKNLWKYLRNYINLDASSSWLMAVFIVSCGAMVSCSKQYWDVQSHKTNSSTSTVIASPSKFLIDSLSDVHPDCSDSGSVPLWADFGADSDMYQPVLIEEHDVIMTAHD